MVFTLKKKSRQSITFGKTGLQCVNLWLKKYVEQQSETAFQQVNLGPNCCVRRLTETGLQHTSYYHPLPYTFCQTIFGNCTTTHRKLSNYATSSYIVVGIIVTTSRGRCCCFGSILCWNHWLVPLHQWGIQGRAWGDRPLPPLFLDQAEAQKAEKNFLGTARRLHPSPPQPLYLRVWMTAAPYLKVWMGTVPLGVISCSHGIKLEKVGPTVSSFKSMSIFAIRGNRRQETVSMPFIFRI